MDEHSTSALQYGHFGKAVYVPETRSWSFSRTLSQSSSISYTGATKTAVASPLTAPQSSLVENKNILPRVHPELAACWSLVSNETFSHVITTTSEICDTQVSSLLDLGCAVDLENDDSGSRVVPVAVFASGECGNSISFRKLEEDTLELRQNTTWMRVPSIGETDAAEWRIGGAPIRQICFAQTVEEKATWMAARCPDSTTIFRPLYHRDPVPMRICRDSNGVPSSSVRNSRLDANPLVEISSLRTGGFPHADVTFNPWYQRQFAIVDQRGNWSIWEMSGRHRRNKGNWAATCVKSGSLPWLDNGDSLDLDNQLRHDGWAVIEWAGDVNSIIVSDRRCPMLYRMEGDQIWSIPIELGLKRKSEWILDIKRSPSNASHVYVLTTTRILRLEFTPSAESPGEGDTGSIYPRLSWRHYRDPEDTTLRLSVLLDNEDFYLFLYSRLNNFVLGFQFPNAIEEELNNTVTVPDPFVLDVPSTVDVSPESQVSTNSAQFSTLVFKQIAHSPASVGKLYYDPSARLSKLFLLDSRLAVCESVYIGPAVTGDIDVEEQPLGRDVLRVKRRQQNARRTRAVRYRDDFVVDDWDESVSGKGATAIPNTGISTVSPHPLPQWTTDYTAIYAVATGRLILGSSEGEFSQHSEELFKGNVIALADKIANTTSSDQAASTLLEVFGSSPLLDDIEKSALIIEDAVALCQHREADPQSEYRLSILPPGLSISPLVHLPIATECEGKLNLVYIYDRLVSIWLSNLPHNIPGRTRITKERIIRRLATDLVLARINITRRPPDGANEDHLDNRDDAEFSNPETSFDFHRTATPQRSSVPTFERDGGGSASQNDLAAASSGVSGSHPTNRVPVYSTLSSLTTYKSQHSMPRSVEFMLSHWVPGMDPAAYDWQRTVYSVEEDESQRMSRSVTPRNKLRKKTPQGTAMSSPAPPPISPAVPDIYGQSSQPTNGGLHRGILQSSQVTAVDEDLPMTQVERGLFGGREANKKSIMKTKKKKRAAGF